MLSNDFLMFIFTRFIIFSDVIITAAFEPLTKKVEALSKG